MRSASICHNMGCRVLHGCPGFSTVSKEANWKCAKLLSSFSDSRGTLASRTFERQ